MRKTGDFKTGQNVIYTAGHGEKESGVVTSTNDKFVFVRYGNNLQSQATSPEDLS